MTDQQKENFYSLVPERVLTAVEDTGVRCTGRILQLNSMENRVYEAEIEIPDSQEVKSRHERFRVVKFYRPGRWSRTQIQEEHEFLLDLKEQEVPAIAPFAFPQDKLTIHTDSDLGIFYSVFPKSAGRTLDELSPNQLERIGRLVARLHIVGASREANHRWTLTTSTYGRDSLQFLLQGNFIPKDMEGRFAELVTNICEVCEERLKGVPLQRVHGDLHCGNILWDNDYCFLVDFDDMLRGPCVQDLWLLVPGRDEDAKKRWELLIRGYEQLRPFDHAQTELIETLRSLRIIYFTAWIARRWEDPAFQRVFPAFGSLEYWRDQLITLDEQLRYLHSGALEW